VSQWGVGAGPPFLSREGFEGRVSITAYRFTLRWAFPF